MRKLSPGCRDNARNAVSAVIARCGEHRVHHWAHRGKRHCDHWWENETEWHRAWKNQFPDECQEVLLRSGDGEKHIADVKTEHGRVIEFQHSFLNPEERRAREAFYRRMYWVVDGLRRKRDAPNFIKVLQRAVVPFPDTSTFLVLPENCAILKDWADSRVPVFLDFGAPILCALMPRSPKGWAQLSPVDRTEFVASLRNGLPMKAIPARAFLVNPVQARVQPRRHSPLPQRGGVLTFQQYLARKDRARKRRRL